MAIFKLPVSLRRVAVNAVMLLPIVLAGCGGSNSSSSSSPTSTLSSAAIISQSSSGGVSSDYTLSLLPSGAATYNLYTLLPPTTPGVAPGPTQTGTVPAVLTAKFFQDLSAAMPLQNLPAFYGGGSVISTRVSVRYNGQTGPVDNPTNAQEVTLEADVVAIAKALGLPQY